MAVLSELSGMALHEIAHVRRCFAGELAHRVRHAVVTPAPRQLRHGREMPDEVLGKSRLPKAFAPRRERDIAISDRPAERLGEDERGSPPLERGRRRRRLGDKHLLRQHAGGTILTRGVVQRRGGLSGPRVGVK